MSEQHFIDFLKDKSSFLTTDITKIKFGEVKIYIISKVSKKLISVFYISLKNLNDELGNFLSNIDNKNNDELIIFESKETINGLKSSFNEYYNKDINENHLNVLNEGFEDFSVQTNIPELESFNEITTNNIRIDKSTIRKIQKLPTYVKPNKMGQYIPQVFIIELNSLIKNYSEILRSRGTASSSITFDTFESGDITLQRNITDFSQQPFMETNFIGDQEEQERSYFLNEKLQNLNQVEKGEFFLDVLKRAQRDELVILQENEFTEIFIDHWTPEK